MPQQDKSAATHVSRTSLQGASFTPANDTECTEALDKAFDYRGDITLILKNDSTLDGFLFNRNAKLRKAELFIKGEDAPKVVSYDEIKSIAFSGKDPADGKSWENWTAKKEAERKAEDERIRQESIARGEL